MKIQCKSIEQWHQWKEFQYSYECPFLLNYYKTSPSFHNLTIQKKNTQRFSNHGKNLI